MRFRFYVLLGAALVALTPGVGIAQDRMFHVNVGGGVGFKLEGGEIYVESRFHYVAGTDYTTPAQQLPVGIAPKTFSSRGYYYPVTIGFRF